MNCSSGAYSFSWVAGGATWARRISAGSPGDNLNNNGVAIDVNQLWTTRREPRESNDGQIVFTPRPGTNADWGGTFTAQRWIASAQRGAVAQDVPLTASVSDSDGNFLGFSSVVSFDESQNAYDYTYSITNDSSSDADVSWAGFSVFISAGNTWSTTVTSQSLTGEEVDGSATFTIDGESCTSTAHYWSTYSNNTSPEAVTLTSTSNGATAIIVPVIANNSDPDGDGLAVVAVGSANYGSVTINSDGTVTYTPNPEFSAASDTFTYTIGDGIATSTASVTVVFNYPPVLASIGGRSVDEGSTLSFTATATDPENATLSFSLDSGAPIGASINSQTGQFSLPAADGPATLTVTVRVTDSAGQSDFETVTITVDNVAPTATMNVTPPMPDLILGHPTTGLYQVSFTNQYDPSTSADWLAGFTYSYDFNEDGDFDDSGESDLSSSSTTFNFSTNGTHTIHGRIKDKDGGYTDYWTSVLIDWL